jgi:hypothetical protein
MSGLPYPYEESKTSWKAYTDPYTVPVDVKGPPGPIVVPFIQPAIEHASIVKYIETDWQVNGQAFVITADLSPVMAMFGPGVYTIVIWGLSNSQSSGLTGSQLVLTTQYSVFVT